MSNPYECEEWSEVESRNLAAVGRLGGDLYVRFRSEVTYRYPKLGYHYPEILASDSKGVYFNRHVRKCRWQRLCLTKYCPNQVHGPPLNFYCEEHGGGGEC